MTRYKSAVQKRNAAVLLRKPGRLASQYAHLCNFVIFEVFDSIHLIQLTFSSQFYHFTN